MHSIEIRHSPSISSISHLQSAFVRSLIIPEACKATSKRAKEISNNASMTGTALRSGIADNVMRKGGDVRDWLEEIKRSKKL